MRSTAELTAPARGQMNILIVHHTIAFRNTGPSTGHGCTETAIQPLRHRPTRKSLPSQSNITLILRVSWGREARMGDGDRKPSAALLGLVNGYQVSQAIHVAATLGIADLLKNGPRSSDDLAAVTGTHAGSLYRLLRALASVGVFRENTDRRFALTPLGDCLRSHAPVTNRPVGCLHRPAGTPASVEPPSPQRTDRGKRLSARPRCERLGVPRPRPGGGCHL